MSEIFKSFKENEAALKRVFARYFRNSADIEDLTQETFLKCFAAEAKSHIRQPKSFLFRAAKNLALSEKRKKFRKTTDYLEDSGGSDVYIDNTLVSEEERLDSQRKLAILAEAIASLPEEYRKAILMRKMEHLKLAQIARRTNVTVRTAQKRVAVALDMCDTYLQRKGYEPSEFGRAHASPKAQIVEEPPFKLAETFRRGRMTNKLKNVVPLPDVGSINAQASEWVVLLSDGDVTAENMAAFKVWYAKSEKHRLAFQARSELWGDLDLVSRLDDYAASEAVAELRREDRNILSTMPMGRRSVLGALAASIAVAAGATIVLDTSIPPSTEPEMRFQTAVGEQQEILLTDGSKVYLNTSSEVRVAFTDDARVLHLLRGEAHFDVESDPERAFSVVAGQNTITAIGTAFSVRRLDGTDKVDVKVSHGRVAVFDQPVAVSVSKILSREYSPMAEMTAGETALLGRTIEQVQTVTPKELARQLAWRDGVLAFAGDPLSDVVSEITRYTGVSIEIESETFKDYPISGYTKIGEYEEMFEALEIMTGLKAVRVSSDRVQLVEVEN